MLDAKLIGAAIQDRAAWEIMRPHIVAKDLSPPAAFWIPLIETWYDNDKNATAIDREILSAQGRRAISNPKHVDLIMSVLGEDSGAVPSAANVADELVALKTHNTGLELATAIAKSDAKDISRLLPEYQRLFTERRLAAGERAEWEDAVSWEELDAKVGNSAKIPLIPRILNDRTGGGALRGQHLLIVGRPEDGKSSFAINLLAGLLRRQYRGLYIGNEDSINVLKSRMRSRLSGMSSEAAAADPATANRLAREVSGDRLFMRHMHRGTIGDIEKAVQEFEPDILVLDQIRNVESKEDGMTQKLERVAIGVRYLLSKYKMLGISVTQANERSQGYSQQPPVWLGMADIDSSRTGLPGQADLIIGLGADRTMRDRGQRAVSLPKNKLSSAPGSHEGFIVQFDPTIAKFTSEA